MRVSSPSLYGRTPLSDSLQAEGAIVYDSISGASPLYHNTLSGASHLGVTDYRRAGDAKLTKYFNNFSVGVGATVSTERDYFSRALSLDVRVASDDRNRTFDFGVGGASDRINLTNGLAENKKKQTVDLLAGITQALSPDAIVQSTLTYTDGHGFYSYPYKTLDARPITVSTGVAHPSQPVPSTIRRDDQCLVSLSSRFLRQQLAGHRPDRISRSKRLDLAPNARYYTQSAVLASTTIRLSQGVGSRRPLHRGHAPLGLRPGPRD